MMTALIPRLKAVGIPAAGRKRKIRNSFIFDVFPFIEIHHARYENNINLNIFLGWLFYSISVEFEKYDD